MKTAIFIKKTKFLLLTPWKTVFLKIVSKASTQVLHHYAYFQVKLRFLYH
ncbi:hypothetical protein B4065_3380 [Caldibacillus thermoamylovorans]|nr:hypothetical protein B4065_3380 [Caldibacillus thermoamylovorans]